MKITKTSQIAEGRLLYASVLMLLIATAVGLRVPPAVASELVRRFENPALLAGLSVGAALLLGYVSWRWVNPPLMAATKERRIVPDNPLTLGTSALVIRSAILHFAIAMLATLPLWLIH